LRRCGETPGTKKIDQPLHYLVSENRGAFLFRRPFSLCSQAQIKCSLFNKPDRVGGGARADRGISRSHSLFALSLKSLICGQIRLIDVSGGTMWCRAPSHGFLPCKSNLARFRKYIYLGLLGHRCSTVLHSHRFCKVGEASIYQYGGDFGAFFDFGFVYLVFGNGRYVKSCS